MSRQFETYAALGAAIGYSAEMGLFPTKQNLPDLTVGGETWKFEHDFHGNGVLWSNEKFGVIYATPGWEGAEDGVPFDVTLDGDESKDLVQEYFTISLPRISMDAYLAAVATVIQLFTTQEGLWS